jgi:hypothetical protein
LAGVIGVTGISRSNGGMGTVYVDRTLCLGQLDETSRLSLAGIGIARRRKAS